MEGIKHTVKCRCILSQFRKKANPPLHKFIVFSILENDSIVSTRVKCNNCGITHKITDICKSEILDNSDDWEVITEKDVMLSFSDDLKNLLGTYDVDLPTLQMAQWIIENQKWGSQIILSKKQFEDRTEGKVLVFKGHNQYRVDTFLESFNEF